MSLSAQQKAEYTDLDRASYYFYYEKWDSALLYLNSYVDKATDSLKKGKAYSYMGEVQKNIGDLYGAQETLMNGVRSLNPSNQRHREELAIIYNILGSISVDLKNYDEAVSLYNKAISFLSMSAYAIEINNGKAIALQRKGDYDKAIAIYDSILKLQPKDRLLKARIIHNRARTKWLQHADYNPLPEYYDALQIRADSNYGLGLNASYAHLADYYEKVNTDSALRYAQKMYDIAQFLQSSDDELEAIDKLIRFNNSPIVKQQWYLAFRRLSDSVQLSRDSTRSRFAMVRYDLQKKEADNLVLQQHVTKQRIGIYSLIALTVLVITALWNWYNKRRKHIKQEAEKTIRESKLATSQKVHDVVANGLYRIMNELEHGKTIELDPLLDKIEILYEKSRDISYDEHLFPAVSSNYSKQVQDLLMAFENEQTHVVITGNDQAFWSRISTHQKNELQLILTEIMVNMKKHSQAKNVAIAFRQDQYTAFITYTDNGIGFTPGQQFGNGLNNTVNRIKSLNGDVIFGESGPGGIRISISWPLQSIII